MRVYEEYDSPLEKRLAQRASFPLKRRMATGHAPRYLIVLDEDGKTPSGNLSALLSNTSHDPELNMGYVGDVHLKRNCRMIGFESLPKKWQRAFVKSIKGWDEEVQSRYQRLFKIAAS